MRKYKKASYPSPLRGAIVAIAKPINAPDASMEYIPGGIIGANGGLPWTHTREDLKRFQRITLGYIIIMGRKTWDSIQQKKLPNRRNIVISRNAVNGVEHYDSVDAAVAACGDEDFWVIGGGQIYTAALPHLNLLDITYMPDKVTHTNTVQFPNVPTQQWRKISTRYQPLKSASKKLQHVVYRRR